jgi:hypothetical protein
MTAEPNALRVGDKAPEFAIATVDRGVTLHRLAAQCQQLVLTTQDSYRYHPN